MQDDSLGGPPLVAIKPPLPAREVRPPTDAEIDALMAKTPEPLVLYFAVAESLGARRSDLIALQWDDFDLDAQTVTIRRARTYAAGKVHQHDGKTGRKAHRVLALDTALTELLRAHRRHQVGLALAAGLASPVWVFSHDAGVRPRNCATSAPSSASRSDSSAWAIDSAVTSARSSAASSSWLTEPTDRRVPGGSSSACSIRGHSCGSGVDWREYQRETFAGEVPSFSASRANAPRGAGSPMATRMA